MSRLSQLRLRGAFNPLFMSDKSLGTKLATLVAVLLAVISVFIYLYFPSRQEMQALEDRQETVALLTDNVAHSVESEIVFNDLKTIERDIQSMRRIPDLSYACVRGDSGRVLSVFRRDSTLVTTELAGSFANHISADGRLFVCKSPVTNSGVKIGEVELGFSLDEVRAELALSRAGIALVSFAVFAYGMIAVLAIGRYLTRPLKEMVLVTERISSGELSERAVANTNDEVGQLAASFNRMVTHLQDALSQLTAFNDTLEERVKTRTTELEHEIAIRRQTEVELKAALTEAERAQKVKAAFISNMSHEIRTPLNVIMGYSSLLREELGDRVNPEEARYFESIHRGGERLMRTIGDIMSISRIEAGDLKLDKQRIDLIELARAATFDLAPTAEKKSLELKFHSRLKYAIVVADSYCVMQALTNLIDNAIKYTRTGSVTVSLETEGKGARLSVSDTGIGISAEYLPYLFDPYTQEDSGIGRSYEGIGLGLTLVRKYCDLQEAKVEVTSTKEEGSTFSIIFAEAEAIELRDTQAMDERLTVRANSIALPELKIPHLLTPEEPTLVGLTSPPISEPDGGEMLRQKPDIIIVEDDPASQAYLNLILRKHFVLHRAESYDEAMVLLAKRTYQVMVTDISLAGAEDGLTLIRHVKSVPAYDSMPVIALTAHVFPEDRARIIAAGCDEFITKPIMKDDLLAAIRRAIGARVL